MNKEQKVFKKIIEAFKERSTCERIKVSAIIVRDGRIISTGWNGAPSKKQHCKEYFRKKYKEPYSSITFNDEHRVYSERNEIHAEQNVLSYAARNGIKTDGTILYISISPCLSCAKLICASGIKEVYYFLEYDRDRQGIDFLNENNIICEELK